MIYAFSEIEISYCIIFPIIKKIFNFRTLYYTKKAVSFLKQPFLIYLL